MKLDLSSAPWKLSKNILKCSTIKCIYGHFSLDPFFFSDNEQNGVSICFCFRCFSDITQCTDGYSFSVWLNTNSTATKVYVLSSGGQTTNVIIGGMALLLVESKLKVMFRYQPAKKLWADNAIEIPLGEWFHFAATWHLQGSLDTFLNGEFLNSKYGEGNITVQENPNVPSEMHLGKPNNAGNKYGDFAIDEWYFWNFCLGC